MYEDIKDNPVIIMNGLDNKQILKVMKAVKEIEGLPKIIFASTTKINSEWKLQDLISELTKEHEEMMKVSKNIQDGVYDK
ncbi:MAG: DUF3783 domain-containing protein [Thermotogae bacterium]|nr:DUF3783 domain-containing protein [Thermotogota bacterium]MCP5465808.1 DUF3783 domain-containing protein [Thermotogota bacterium]HOO75842.1 DUF3783 domain-containing protein [Tepiditoga sp.]